MTTIKVQPVNDVKGPVERDDLLLNPPQKLLIAGGVLVAVVLFAYLLATQHISQSMLLGIGLLLGFTLFHARFGFTSAFRRMASVGNGQAMRSHMLMLAIAVTLFAPILAYGTTFFGGPVAGYVSPVGVSLIVGAFVFGIGMQLGGGCASGTLYAIGGGRTVMFVTLAFFHCRRYSWRVSLTILDGRNACIRSGFIGYFHWFRLWWRLACLHCTIRIHCLDYFTD